MSHEKVTAADSLAEIIRAGLLKELGSFPYRFMREPKDGEPTHSDSSARLVEILENVLSRKLHENTDHALRNAAVQSLFDSLTVPVNSVEDSLRKNHELGNILAALENLVEFAVNSKDDKIKSVGVAAKHTLEKAADHAERNNEAFQNRTAEIMRQLQYMKNPHLLESRVNILFREHLAVTRKSDQNPTHEKIREDLLKGCAQLFISQAIALIRDFKDRAVTALEPLVAVAKSYLNANGENPRRLQQLLSDNKSITQTRTRTPP